MLFDQWWKEIKFNETPIHIFRENTVYSYKYS